MAFRSEDSGKWKVFAKLAAMVHEDKLSESTISELTRVSLGTVQAYLNDFVRIIPEHIGREGKPPLYFFRSIGMSNDAIYGKIKDHYNKRAKDFREAKKTKKDKEQAPIFPFAQKGSETPQRDFVVGKPPMTSKKEENPPQKPAADMRGLCLEAATYVVERIKTLCRDNGSCTEIKILIEALSKLDDIDYALNKDGKE